MLTLVEVLRQRLTEFADQAVVEKEKPKQRRLVKH
jgi:hypothetical protein